MASRYNHKITSFKNDSDYGFENTIDPSVDVKFLTRKQLKDVLLQTELAEFRLEEERRLEKPPVVPLKEVDFDGLQKSTLISEYRAMRNRKKNEENTYLCGNCDYGDH